MKKLQNSKNNSNYVFEAFGYGISPSINLLFLKSAGQITYVALYLTAPSSKPT